MSELIFDKLYEWLQEEARVLGWGLLCFLRREDLDRLLLQVYIRRFNTGAYLAPIYGSIPNGDDRRFALSKFTLDWPRLSFSPKLSNDSRARLYMRVIEGIQLGLVNAGGDWRVREIRETSPLQGPELSLDLLLAYVPGVVGAEGRVRLDLRESSDFTMQVTDDPVEQRLVGQFFQQKFEALPDAQRVLPLGQIEAGGNPLLEAASFSLRTQARGRNDKDGEGAVLALIRYEGDKEGDYPGPAYTYLLPSDREYDATVLFDPNRIMLAQLLESLRTVAKDVEFEITRDDEGRPSGARATRGLMQVPGQTVTERFETEPDLWGRYFKMVLQLKISPVDLHLDEVLNVYMEEGKVVVEWRLKGEMTIEPLDLDDETGCIKSNLIKFGFDTSDFYKPATDDFEYVVTSTYRLVDEEGGTLEHEAFEMKEVKAPAPKVGEIKPPENPRDDPIYWLILGLFTGGMVWLIAGAILVAVAAVLKAVGNPQFPSVESVVRDALERNFKFSSSVKQLVQDTIKLNFGNTIVGEDQYAPNDIAFFGNINPAVTAFAVDPMEHTLTVGSAPKQFISVPANNNLEWSIESVVDTVLDSKIGSINKDTGLYTPPTANEVDGAFVQLRVNAVDKATPTNSSSALVTVMKKTVQINPLAYVAQAKATINLQAGYFGDASKLTWALKNPGHGTLVGSGATATYTAPEKMPPSNPQAPEELAAYAVDEVQLSAPGDGHGQTAVLITESADKLPLVISRVVDPTNGTVQLTAKVNGNPVPPAKVVWGVRYGSQSGEIDPATGIFKHLPSGSDLFALITASVDGGFLGTFEGYVLQTLPPVALEDAVQGVGAYQVQKHNPVAERHGPSNVKRRAPLSKWLADNPDLQQWDSITGVSLSAGNASLSQTHASHLEQGQGIDNISGELEIEMTDIVYHFAGYQMSAPQVGIGRVSYENARLDMLANLHGGTLVKAQKPYKVLSLAAHDPLDYLELSQQVPLVFKEGALVLDVSKGENVRLAVSDDLAEQSLAGDWLQQQLPANPGKLDYSMLSAPHAGPERALQAAYLGTQADDEGKGDTLVMFASSGYGREGNFPGQASDFPRLLPTPPQPDAAVELLSSRLLHRNAYLNGFKGQLTDAIFDEVYQDGRLASMVASAGRLQVPDAQYPSSDYLFKVQAFDLDVAGGLQARFELDWASQHLNIDCSMTFSCQSEHQAAAEVYTATFELSLHHRYYLLAGTEPGPYWLEGQFFSPWPEQQEARVLKGLPEGDEYAELRVQAEDFAAFVIRQAILQGMVRALDPAAAEHWLKGLQIGASTKLQPGSFEFPGAMAVSASLAANAELRIRDVDEPVLVGREQPLDVENPGQLTLTWTVKSLPGGPTHPGVIKDGKYTAPSADTLQGRSGQVLVSASAGDQRCDVVITVMRQSLRANPFITTMQAGTERILTAAALGKAPLKWTNVTNDPGQSGELVEEAQGRRCRYLAKPANPGKPNTYWLDEIQVAGADDKQSLHVLVIQREPAVLVTLAETPRADGRMKFVARINGNLVTPEWELGVGPGTIDADGLYTPPQSADLPPGILVLATFKSDDFGTFEGHLIMPLQATRFPGLCSQLLAPQSRSV